MRKGLRSRLAQYGDEEFALFLRRGFLKGAGFTDEALDRPIVGVLSTASDFNPCHATAGRLAEAVSRGVRLAGALPFVFPTISLHEAFSFPTSMLLRNLMAMDVEEMLRALPLDAVVLIGGCDKTIPAELMGAISADMPAIVLPVGSMLAGRHEGARLGACTDCRRLWAAFRAGKLDGAELDRAHDQLMPTAGTCMVMGTASTMACIAETLGFTLPGAATAPAVSSDRIRIAEATGKRAVEMAVTGSPTPRAIISRAALRNASVILQATSGSTNALVHLAAIAGRAGLSYDLAEFDAVGRETPVLLNLKPAGSFFMEDFHAGGGLPALWRRLKDRLDLSAPTVNGETIGDIIARWPAWVDDEVVRPRERPLCPSEAIAILSGNLAPSGAAIKLAAATPSLCTHEGPALVFDSLKDLAERIDHPDLAGDAAARHGAAQCGSDRRAGHAGSRRAADPEEARGEGRDRHGADFRCAHERHRVRHRGAAHCARSLGRRTAGAGARRRHDRARCCEAPHRSQGRGRRTCAPPREMDAAPTAGARLHPPLCRARDPGRQRLRLRFSRGLTKVI